ncbi:hypothetical protein FPV16_05545 [Methylobacterium sp. W2]|uniref:hypothetical protein n=1 Tax=Methylobacterium sp. W2 TaxID=2598107 RepID=UPI001D0C3289|nr:hypothetical protein [Methylobacterium sp. W2]MCC0805693.1 hypothetical protein [Methylobacterium sp. W2]
MIETVMIFALGFLAASLCALMVLPAVSARATRLAKRRLEGLVPLSASEIAAEKDYLRARFAVTQRRLERKVEAARGSRHADMAAIGARTLEIAALSRNVEQRDAALASTRATLDGVERDLAAARAEGTLSLATLEVLENAHRDLLDDLHALREAKVTQADVVTGDDEAGQDLNARYLALLAECEALRTAKAPPDAEIAALRQRIVEVADSLLRQNRLPSVDVFAMPASQAGSIPVKRTEPV